MTNDPWGAATPPTSPPDSPAETESAPAEGVPTTTAPSRTVLGRGARATIAGSMLVAAAALGVTIGHVEWARTITTLRAGIPFPRVDFPGSAPSSPGTGASGGPKHPAAIEEKVDPAVVDIRSTFAYLGSAGEGTGIVLTSNGEVLTNNHVIDGATSLSVTDVGNGTTYAATVVGYDSSKDLAVLQLTGASGLTTATIGDSSRATVGESVLAIGNAGGVGGTPSAAGGTITALSQSITATDSLDGTDEHLSGLVATDANVLPGDSGGPLVDSKGEVLAIDTASSASQGFEFSSQQSGGAQGYAIPIDEAIGIAQMIEYGAGSSSVHIGSTAFLGVFLSGRPAPVGVLVQSTVPGGAAATSGIVAGDALTSVNGRAVDSPTGVSSALVTLHPGDAVKVKGLTATGRAFTVNVTLASGPPA
jgi:S1-C subfamily serine protease